MAGAPKTVASRDALDGPWLCQKAKAVTQTPIHKVLVVCFLLPKIGPRIHRRRFQPEHRSSW